jgi:HEAT repeat protein
LKQAFAAGLQDQDANVRQASTAGLGNLSPNAAEFLPLLMNLLNDPTPDVRLAAVDAIGKMNYVDGLRRALSNPDSQVRAAASGTLRAIAPREK